MINKNIPAFFAGASAPDGFVSYFSHLYNPDKPTKVYVLKGGPGTGKSSLMKKLAAALDEKGEKYELFYCSADPASLDAVRIIKNGTVILDGTAPHMLDPAFPGACERTVNLGECLDNKYLFKNRSDIIRIFRENGKYHSQAKRYISAAGSLTEDTRAIGLLCSNLPKVDSFINGTAEKNIPSKKGSAKGTEIKRFLSAVTPNGITAFTDSVGLLAQNVFVINDGIGAVSGMIIGGLKNKALSRGYDVISLICPLSLAAEHIIIPELSLAFCTSNSFHEIEPKGHRTIHARRFTDPEFLSTYRKRITFNKKAVKEMISSASFLIKKANDIHIELEKYYVAAMDFKKVDKISDGVISEILADL